jgi:hypothetical protein
VVHSSDVKYVFLILTLTGDLFSLVFPSFHHKASLVIVSKAFLQMYKYPIYCYMYEVPLVQ